ncbi:cupin domain-containing protein [Paracoccus sp. S-4012]|uniref:cupin domain-containing protein n=1 Tax=Paracoccus sp. S-4012 TaxID=2665648 RepID=UPI0012B060E7|nr:cupin domain-containing protein [Paracoccus sp. S-4012]MRX49933.1 cupin domain-containing protein [Paracoccus sp. S-4012]
MTDAPQVSYWHLYTDGDGVTRQRRCTMTRFEMKAVAEGAAPQWLGPRHEGRTGVVVTVLPPGWKGDWHENPSPQWIVPLSGRWFVESMDGTRVEMGAGEISFGEDQGAARRDGRTGHRSGVVGDIECVLMLVQLEHRRDDASDCPFS